MDVLFLYDKRTERLHEEKQVMLDKLSAKLQEEKRSADEQILLYQSS